MIYAIAEVALIQETAALQTTNLNRLYIDKMKQIHSQTITVLISTPCRLPWMKCLIASRRYEWPNNDTNQVPGTRRIEILSLSLSIRMQPSGLWSHQCKSSTLFSSYLFCTESWHRADPISMIDWMGSLPRTRTFDGGLWMPRYPPHLERCGWTGWCWGLGYFVYLVLWVFDIGCTLLLGFEFIHVTGLRVGPVRILRDGWIGRVLMSRAKEIDAWRWSSLQSRGGRNEEALRRGLSNDMERSLSQKPYRLYLPLVYRSPGERRSTIPLSRLLRKGKPVGPSVVSRALVRGRNLSSSRWIFTRVGRSLGQMYVGVVIAVLLKP